MKIKLVLILAMAMGFMACENQETEFDDFGSTSVYFPFQTPVRTLILGEYDLGFNENDNNGRFEIGVIMSGVYENNTNRQVSFELAPELIDAATIGVDSVNVKVLPASYYTIEQQSPVTIPAGSTQGRIPVQLEDAFFDDPLAFAGFEDVHYVLPLRITAYQGLDSLLTGIPIVDNPIRIKAEDWSPAPKDYTLFGIKFMNKYHGQHLRRGADKVVGTTSLFTISTGETVITIIDTTSVYNNEFIEQDEVTLVSTIGRNNAAVTNRVRRGIVPSSQTVELDMAFADDGDITVTNVEGDRHTVAGSGKYIEDGDEWGGEKRNVMHLEYQYRDLDTVVYTRRGRPIAYEYIDLQHEVKDTLVMRNRDVVFETFTVELTEEVAP